MKSLIQALFCFAILTPVLVFAVDVSGSLSKSRSYFNQGMFGSAIQEGMVGIDGVYTKLVSNVVALIPTVTNLFPIVTNTYYSFSCDNGIRNAYIDISKVYTNTELKLTVKMNNSLYDLQRFNSFFISYEYLKNKEGILKTNTTIGKNRYDFLFKADTVTLIQVYKLENDDIVSGLLITLEFSFIRPATSAEKYKKIEFYLQNFLRNLKTASLKYYLS